MRSLLALFMHIRIQKFNWVAFEIVQQVIERCAKVLFVAIALDITQMGRADDIFHV